jgi:hypothetical protein
MFHQRAGHTQGASDTAERGGSETAKQRRFDEFVGIECHAAVMVLSPKPRSLHSAPWRDDSGLTRFPANESARRTGLHSSLSEKSSFYLPAFEISCRTASDEVADGGDDVRREGLNYVHIAGDNLSEAPWR